MDDYLGNFESETAAAIKSAWMNLSSAAKELIHLNTHKHKQSAIYTARIRHVSKLKQRFTNDADSSHKIVLVLFAAAQRSLQSECQALAQSIEHQCERIATLQSEFDRIWEPTMCDRIQNAFPREIRAIIYSALHDTARSPYLMPLYASIKQDQQEPGHLPLLSSTNVFNRAYFDQQIVGRAVFLEVVEVWYRHVSFDSGTFATIDVEDYLSRDRWGLGLEPAKLIQRFTLTLRGNLVPRSHVGILENLKTLRHLQTHVHVDIHIFANPYHDTHCLGCGKTKTHCQGEFHSFLSRGPKEFEQLMHGLRRLLPPIWNLADTHPRITVTFHHDDVVVLLHDFAEDLSLSLQRWIERLQAEKERITAIAQRDGRHSMSSSPA